MHRFHTFKNMCNFQRVHREFEDLFLCSLSYLGFIVPLKWSTYYSTLKPIDNTAFIYRVDCLKNADFL